MTLEQVRAELERFGGRFYTLVEQLDGSVAIVADEKPTVQEYNETHAKGERPGEGRMKVRLGKFEEYLFNECFLYCYWGDPNGDNDLDLVVTGPREPQ